MERIPTKRKMEARGISAVYRSMRRDRIETIDRRIRKSTFDFDLELYSAVEEAADRAIKALGRLLARGYTEEEIDAVLTHHNRGRFDHLRYRDLKDVWTDYWLPDPEPEPLAIIEEDDEGEEEHDNRVVAFDAGEGDGEPDAH